MNLHNTRLAQQGKKRRAKMLLEILSGKTPKELAEIYKVSCSRIRWLIAKAKEEKNEAM